MTSLTNPNPSRPDVAPWIRGWTDEPPQTSVVWRRYVPAFDERFDRLNKKQISQINGFFDAAPLHLSEKLETETHRVVAWLLDRAQHYRPTSSQERQVLVYVLDSKDELRPSQADSKKSKTSHFLRWSDLQAFQSATKLEKDRLKSWLVGATLVILSDFGGLSEEGLLDSKRREKVKAADDIKSELGADTANEWPGVFFKIFEETEEIQGLPHHFKFVGDPDAANSKTLFVTKRAQELGALNEADRSITRKDRFQTLDDHQIQAETHAYRFGGALGLPEAYREMLRVAARFHDEGKRAWNWQRAFRAPNDDVYAKTPGPIDQAILAGYRHELGSLRTLETKEEWKALAEPLRELALHLVIAHHGQGRPSVRTEGCLDVPPSILQEQARAVTHRFAAMQRQWGPLGLAWWEALLRAVDQQASRDAKVLASLRAETADV